MTRDTLTRADPYTPQRIAMADNRQIRRVWAIFTSFLDKDTADWLIHAFTIVKFGKESLKELSDSEIEELCAWGEVISGGNYSGD